MKNFLLTTMAVLTFAGAVNADTYSERLTTVDNSVTATSEGQWLPYWNDIAVAQLRLLKDNPELSTTDALNEAIEDVGPHTWVWDDFWWCSGQSGFTVDGDVQFDYCSSIDNPFSDKFPASDDPDPSTTFGGLLFDSDGRA